MYDVIKAVIYAGNYKLSEIQHKIKKMYAHGDLTDDQMDELINLAGNGASSDAERPETLDMLRKLYERLGAFESRMDDFDERLKALQTDNPEEPDVDSDATIPTYEPWEPWDGISNKYQINKIVSHIDKLWISTYKGQNVWEPGAPGIDERFWKEYIPES